MSTINPNDIPQYAITMDKLSPGVVDAINSKHPLGTVIYSLRNDTPLGFVEANGNEYTETQFPDFYRMIEIGKLPSKNYSQYDAEILANSGNCGFFGLDLVNRKFRMIKLTDAFIRSTMDESVVGQYGTDQIVNILGSFTGAGQNPTAPNTATGSFYFDSVYNKSGPDGADYNNNTLYFDASRVVNTGDQVQPRNIKMYAYVCVYNAGESSRSITNMSTYDISDGYVTNCILSGSSFITHTMVVSSNSISASPGLCVLIPNGRNADNTLKNIKYTLPSLITYTRSGNTELIGYLLLYVYDGAGQPGHFDLSPAGIIYQDNIDASADNLNFVKIGADNYGYKSNGTSWVRHDFALLGNISYDVLNHITDINVHYPLEVLKKNDLLYTEGVKTLLADNSITNDKLTANSISTEKIQNNSITLQKIHADVINDINANIATKVSKSGDTMTGELIMQSVNPAISFRDSDVANRFKLRQDSESFKILADRDGNGVEEVPTPVVLNSTENKAYFFGKEVVTTDMIIPPSYPYINWIKITDFTCDDYLRVCAGQVYPRYAHVAAMTAYTSTLRAPGSIVFQYDPGFGYSIQRCDSPATVLNSHIFNYFCKTMTITVTNDGGAAWLFYIYGSIEIEIAVSPTLYKKYTFPGGATNFPYNVCIIVNAETLITYNRLIGTQTNANGINPYTFYDAATVTAYSSSDQSWRV